MATITLNLHENEILVEFDCELEENLIGPAFPEYMSLADTLTRSVWYMKSIGEEVTSVRLTTHLEPEHPEHHEIFGRDLGNLLELDGDGILRPTALFVEKGLNEFSSYLELLKTPFSYRNENGYLVFD